MKVLFRMNLALAVLVSSGMMPSGATAFTTLKPKNGLLAPPRFVSTTGTNSGLPGNDDQSLPTTTPELIATTTGEIQQSSSSLMQKLLKISNFASFLCMLDCTILPAVTIVLPLFGVVAATPAQMDWLHELGHQIALYFVMPVGGMATTLNYTNHRKKWILSLGVAGLFAVFSANAGCALAHSIPGRLGHALHEWLEIFHHGILHRVTNIVGCFMLLSSNYLSQRQGACKVSNCSHHHGHDHDHDHNH